MKMSLRQRRNKLEKGLADYEVMAKSELKFDQTRPSPFIAGAALVAAIGAGGGLAGLSSSRSSFGFIGEAQAATNTITNAQLVSMGVISMTVFKYSTLGALTAPININPGVDASNDFKFSWSLKISSQQASMLTY